MSLTHTRSGCETWHRRRLTQPHRTVSQSVEMQEIRWNLTHTLSTPPGGWNTQPGRPSLLRGTIGDRKHLAPHAPLTTPRLMSTEPPNSPTTMYECRLSVRCDIVSVTISLTGLLSSFYRWNTSLDFFQILKPPNIQQHVRSLHSLNYRNKRTAIIWNNCDERYIFFPPFKLLHWNQVSPL